VLNRNENKIQHCLNRLAYSFERNFGGPNHPVEKIISQAARFALETIAKSDAPYHDVEHTILVTLAGQAILEGLALSERTATEKEWGHFTLALLFHDIGYVKGICKADHGSRLATGVGDETIELPITSTDAALARYHVDRSKLCVRERFGQEFDLQKLLEIEVITGYIEMTRFPFTHEVHKHTDRLTELVRAADLIGQLGDPNRLQKCSALFEEFEEIGLNAQLGYRRPEDLRNDNTRFYWKIVNPQIQGALRLLNLTPQGRRWAANLQANVGERII
jgi:hypothetical protein